MFVYITMFSPTKTLYIVLPKPTFYFLKKIAMDSLFYYDDFFGCLVQLVRS